MTRIAIYGGTDLPPELVQFVRYLTRKLINIHDVVLVSGGFEYFREYRDRISVDLAVLREAKQCINEPHSFDLRFETWLPTEKLDRPTDQVKRFAEGKVYKIPGTDQARRFNLVKAVDGLVTIRGEGNTRTVLELALALEKAALPIAFTGGDSKTLWDSNREIFIQSLNLRPELVSRLEGETPPLSELEGLAMEVAQVLYDAAKKRCLVLMPFGLEHDSFYQHVLYHAIKEANYIPHRIDIDDYAGNIPSLFLASLERARSVIVDVTGLNPNVMYELGQVHARGINPFLIDRRRQPITSTDAMPFYLRHEKLVSELDDDIGHRRISHALTQYLNAVATNADEQRRRT